MARELVERFICDRTGAVEIRRAGTTLDSMDEPQDDSPDFRASLKCEDGSEIVVVFQDLCSEAKREVLAMLREIEGSSATEATPTKDAPVEDAAPEAPAKPVESPPSPKKRSRRTMAEITKERVTEHGLLEAFDSLSDDEQAEYLRADKIARKQGDTPPHIDIKEEEELVEEEESAPKEEKPEGEDEEEGDFF
jgi:hypothetical protein